ncbi:glucose 1-dehydrogenase [Paracoccus sp. Z118]|uniref:SDR family NAD(P)-dependent oxidoreductase n=1 Tax=Paracoccus sp. Z118 TaxID=2851017 RepID=UPI001C2C79B7|nr:glucose 1-dehydrogenase [Paracoccus sp. Z118]MBV0892302.1 glucose 1-dehydrogenase [Paracoccus sp. Z118]
MNPRYDFSGKVAFITGGGSGIGREAALAFARNGASVAVVGRTRDELDETVQIIGQDGGRGLAVTCDVANGDEVKAAVGRTVEAFGRLDFGFNNAGIEQPVAPLHEVTEEDWDRLLDVNLRGVFLCMKHEAPQMMKQGGGVIVNTGSGASVMGIKGQAAYCASKFGLIGLTKAAALDYAGANIRVNAICPGYVDTPMMDRFTGGTPEGRQNVIDNVPAARPASPQEIAANVLWLCSDGGAYIVGHALVIDGGQTI